MVLLSAFARALLFPVTGLLALQAAEIQPDAEYRGPQVLRDASSGITFELPTGWRGGLPPDSECFVMAPAGGAGYIFAGADDFTVAEANEVMSARVPLGDGLFLEPTGPVTVEGDALVGRYDVGGSSETLRALAKAIVGDHGTGIFLIAAFREGDEDAFEAAVSSLSETVRLEAPAEETAPGGVTADAVRGRKITRFFSGSGYSENESLHLCASGAFYRNAESGGYGWNASGAFQSTAGGRWSVERGNLVLTYGDGSVATYELALDGTKLTLDGTRWYREPTDCR